jgi:hypothetical protein
MQSLYYYMLPILIMSGLDLVYIWNLIVQIIKFEDSSNTLASSEPIAHFAHLYCISLFS